MPLHGQKMFLFIFWQENSQNFLFLRTKNSTKNGNFEALISEIFIGSYANDLTRSWLDLTCSWLDLICPWLDQTFSWLDLDVHVLTWPAPDLTCHASYSTWQQEKFKFLILQPLVIASSQLAVRLHENRNHKALEFWKLDELSQS